MDKLYVQFGCGLCAPQGWRNFDASPRLRIEKCPVIRYLISNPLFPKDCEYGDIVKGLPIKPESCDVIYCSHVLEHLSLEDLRVALRNILNLLKHGGVFRLVVPDLESAARNYLKSADEDRSVLFLKTTLLGKEKRPRTFFELASEVLGNSRHLWMWDFRGLAKELKDAGFSEIRQAIFGDHNDSMIERVENADRYLESVGISCRKPTAG
jgi:SAM-dependent methyltransferase